jgi:signal transduction histidine kinase
MIRINLNQSEDSRELSGFDTIRIKIVRYSIVLTILSTFAYQFFLLIFNPDVFSIFALLLLLLLIPQFLAYWFLQKKRYTIAKILFLSGNILTPIMATTIFLGGNAGIHILFLFFMVFPFFIWSFKDRLYWIIFFIISLVTFAYFEFIYGAINTQNNLPDSLKHYLPISVIFTCVVAISIVLIFFQIGTERNEIQLKDKSKELQEKIEELTEKRNELQRLNVSKNKFFSIVAHDLKAPFNTIIGFSELLLHQWTKLNDNEKHEYTKMIFDSSESAYGLLDNLLAWSKMQTDGIEQKSEDINLFQMINDIINVFKNSALQKNIQILNMIPDSQTVYADFYMISTVFRNFISNAIKFTPQNGTITIDSILDENSYLNISISDTGIGMNQKQMETIFNLEKNISTVGTANEMGTGLGLPLCKDFIEKNKGKISVKSKKGEGSTFSVYLLTSS